MDWGARQNKLETPKDKDEGHKQDILFWKPKLVSRFSVDEPPLYLALALSINNKQLDKVYPRRVIPSALSVSHSSHRSFYISSIFSSRSIVS